MHHLRHPDDHHFLAGLEGFEVYFADDLRTFVGVDLAHFGLAYLRKPLFYCDIWIVDYCLPEGGHCVVADGDMVLFAFDYREDEVEVGVR